MSNAKRLQRSTGPPTGTKPFPRGRAPAPASDADKGVGVSNADIIIGEVTGTAVLILLGAGVCAAVTLKKSKAQNAGWLAIAFGWGFAVLTAAYLSAGVS